MKKNVLLNFCFIGLILGAFALGGLTGYGIRDSQVKRTQNYEIVNDMVHPKMAGVPGVAGYIQYLWCDNATASSENIDLNQTQNPAENYNTSYEFYRCNIGDTITISPNNGYVLQTISVTGEAGGYEYDDLYSFNFDTGILTLNYANAEMSYSNVQLSFYISTILDSGSSEHTDTYEFTLNAKPNYNGVLGYSVNSFCVSKPNSATSAQFFYDINLPTFTSNEEEYNQVRIFYTYADNIRYMNSAGELVVNTTSDLSFAVSIIYKNTDTDTAKTVYQRQQGYANGNNNESLHYWSTEWLWVNENYRYLSFDSALTNDQVNELTQLNTGYSTLFNNTTTEVGLNSAFSLLGMAFSSWASIFAIQVIPGLSLGLLLFLPLIVGIIILIIWVVKR